jgi:hypothetical protein
LRAIRPARLLERLLERASGAARDTGRREEPQGTRQQRARE